jgi:RNA polymerase subunit RPABC4/transcription elongation factor Spt4
VIKALHCRKCGYVWKYNKNYKCKCGEEKTVEELYSLKCVECKLVFEGSVEDNCPACESDFTVKQ